MGGILAKYVAGIAYIRSRHGYDILFYFWQDILVKTGILCRYLIHDIVTRRPTFG